MIGTARRLADATGTMTDAYSLDAFGRSLGGWGSTENPYQYGGAWGYLTDPSGMQQLGARFYWPEVGRFVQQDPIGHGVNWYTYVGNGPVTGLDPDGLWYIDVNITLGVVTFGIQYGYDPHASGGPVSVWHPSTWSNSKMWHPYVGPAIGLGGSVQYAPDKKDPFTGTVTPTSPSTGWQRQAAIGIPLAGKWGGIGLAGGNPLNPRKPWYKGLFDPCPPTFGEVGYATPGGSFSAYYVW